MRFLKENEAVLQWLYGLGFPLALVFSSWLVSTSIENTKVDSDYVKLAINILNNESGVQVDKAGLSISSEKKAMRGWAIRVLDQKSPVKLTEREKLAFVREGVDFKPAFNEEFNLELKNALNNLEKLNESFQDKNKK